MSSEPGGPDWVQGEDGDWYPPRQAPQTERSSMTDAPDPEGKRGDFLRSWVTLAVAGLLLLGIAVLFLWFVNENSEEPPVLENGAAQVGEPPATVGDG